MLGIDYVKEVLFGNPLEDEHAKCSARAAELADAGYRIEHDGSGFRVLLDGEPVRSGTGAPGGLGADDAVRFQFVRAVRLAESDWEARAQGLLSRPR